MKFKVKGKTYTVLNEEPVGDPTFIKNIWKVRNSKNELFLLVKTTKQYSLYNDKEVKVASTYSVTFFE